MTMTSAELKTGRRRLMVRDGLAFALLTTATAILFAATLFLFRSFSAHRADLARKYEDRGRAALAQGRPREAIAALRTALAYAPDRRGNELLLAQALGEDGRLDEATNYFVTIWESQPGDGFINLQLARLARRKAEKQSAIDYYRASIYGSWNGDAVVRRREVRFELASYLIDVDQLAAARAELLVAAGNAPSLPAVQLSLGDALLRAGDDTNALNQYRAAIAEAPHNPVAYDKAGRLAYRMGDYSSARDLLEHAVRENGGSDREHEAARDALTTLLRNTERLLILDPEYTSTPQARALRVLGNRHIARQRFDACIRQLPTSAPTMAGAFQALQSRWAGSGRTATRATLIRDPASENQMSDLIDSTERLAAQACGAPQGDDALLLLLAQRSKQKAGA